MLNGILRRLTGCWLNMKLIEVKHKDWERGETTNLSPTNQQGWKKNSDILVE